MLESLNALGWVGSTLLVPATLSGLTGYLASLGALIGTEGIDDTLGAIGHHLHTYEIVSHTQFADRVARRRSELEHR